MNKKEFLQFCNKLRCPLCGSQLDGNIHPKKAILYCVANNSEYLAEYLPISSEPDVEIFRHYYPQYIYKITSVNQQGIFQTKIFRQNMDLRPDCREYNQELIFSNEGKRLLIFRTIMEEKEFLKKLKIYQLFS